MGEHPAKMQRMHVPRLGGEHIAIETIRFGEPAGLMVPDGGNERVGRLHAGEPRAAPKRGLLRKSIGCAFERAHNAPAGPITPHPKG
jgi:hypothetical protein